MIWWPALMDFCSWVPTQKNVLVWGGGSLSFSFVNGIQLPQLPPSPPFACCLMQPGGSAIEGPCLAVCQHGDLPFSLEQLINPISENCCLTKKRPKSRILKSILRPDGRCAKLISSLRSHHFSMPVSHVVANQWPMITRRFESPSCCFLILPDSNPNKVKWWAARQF